MGYFAANMSDIDVGMQNFITIPLLNCTDRRSMPGPCSFRQVEEKHATEARLMIWSPRMDLLALANVQGEVKTSIGLLDKGIIPEMKIHFDN